MSITVSPSPVLPPVRSVVVETTAPPTGDIDREETDLPSPRWVVPALLALLAVTAGAYLWDLSASGYANSFYAAAVQAGTKSWKAFFFGSLDSSNFITVDKSPGSLWVMELSGRLFGFNSWSMLVPQVLEGVAAVGLVFAAVKRWFGPAAGLLAGAVLACTPVAALMFRFNNPDALMVLLLVAAAYALIRALEKAGTRWIVATGALVGFAFLAKMLQAFTVLPAFAGVYLLAAPTGWWRRVRQLALMGVAIVLSAGWWVAIVALWPVASRPMIDGSPDNSILNLIFGYNGLSRLSGGTGGSGAGFSGPAGLFRLFNDLMGGQASWLMPAALLVLVAGLVWRGRAPRTDRTRAALRAVGRMVAGDRRGVQLLRGRDPHLLHRRTRPRHRRPRRDGSRHALAAPASDGGSAHRGGGPRRLRGVGVLPPRAHADLPPVAARCRPHLGPDGCRRPCGGTRLPAVDAARVTGVAVGLALVAALSGPIAFSATTIGTAHTGSIPSAGPAIGAGGSGGGFAGGGPGTGGAPGGAGTGRVPSGMGGMHGGGDGFGGAPPTGSDGSAPAGATPRMAGSGSFGARPDGSATGASGAAGGAGIRGGAVAGGGGATTTSAALTTALRSDAGSYRWVAATFGSQSAADLELASSEPVMAIGGFNGQGGNISLAAFKAAVAKGEIHYFISSGAGGGGAPGGGGSRDSDAAITSWVESHFHSESIGGQTVYDLTSAK